MPPVIKNASRVLLGHCLIEVVGWGELGIEGRKIVDWSMVRDAGSEAAREDA